MVDANYRLQTREWWVDRWLELLDSYRFKKRLERGRNYAREGHVLSIDFVRGKVNARVQGTEQEPYKTSLWIERFSDEDWQNVIETLSQQARFSAELLAGEMPDDIERVFTANGLSLFPFNLSEVRSQCSCPDKKNPCKHIAAVYYQLADRFSEDPFAIFQLRGRSKPEILKALRQLRAAQAEPTDSSTQEAQPVAADAKTTVDPEIDLANYWTYDDAEELAPVAIAPPVDLPSVLNRLGTLRLPPDSVNAIMAYLKQVYPAVSQAALMAAMQQGSSQSDSRKT
ncbi:MAG: SWIM zinc finger family protein [Cyanobacteria bacterium P01_H01_bin.15]